MKKRKSHKNDPPRRRLVSSEAERPSNDAILQEARTYDMEYRAILASEMVSKERRDLIDKCFKLLSTDLIQGTLKLESWKNLYIEAVRMAMSVERNLCSLDFGSNVFFHSRFISMMVDTGRLTAAKGEELLRMTTNMARAVVAGKISERDGISLIQHTGRILVKISNGSVTEDEGWPYIDIDITKEKTAQSSTHLLRIQQAALDSQLSLSLPTTLTNLINTDSGPAHPATIDSDSTKSQSPSQTASPSPNFNIRSVEDAVALRNNNPDSQTPANLTTPMIPWKLREDSAANLWLSERSLSMQSPKKQEDTQDEEDPLTDDSNWRIFQDEEVSSGLSERYETESIISTDLTDCILRDLTDKDFESSDHLRQVIQRCPLCATIIEDPLYTFPTPCCGFFGLICPQEDDLYDWCGVVCLDGTTGKVCGKSWKEWKLDVEGWKSIKKGVKEYERVWMVEREGECILPYIIPEDILKNGFI